LKIIDNGLTFYSARHSYAQWYLAKGGSPLALATLLGRSLSHITTYVSELTSDDDIAAAVEV